MTPAAELFLDADLVGREFEPLTREVTWRQTTNYAAAVGDANPRYLDDSGAGGLIAPPLFAVALTWPLVQRLPVELAGAVDPAVFMRMVHAAEHLVLHAPVRPGGKVTLTGRVAAIASLPGGTLLHVRFDAVDRAGRPLFTEYTAAMFRGVACSGGERGLDTLPALDPPAAAAEPLWRASVAIPRSAPFVYDGCTDIVFPIHTSVSFARAVGLPDIILQGTATFAHAARELVDREAGGDPARLREIAGRFTGPVVPGGEIEVVLTAREGERLAFEVRDAAGAVVLGRGAASIGDI